MKKIAKFFVFSLLLISASCTNDGDMPSSESSTSDVSGEAGNGDGSQGQAGLITAGEWNDLDNWGFWSDLLNSEDYSEMPSHWDFYTNNRLSVVTVNDGVPLINAKVELFKNETLVWTAKTDNLGFAELWVGMFQKEDSIDLNDFSLKVNNQVINQELVLIENGINEININANHVDLNRVEISFIVDATGSMGDELEFLKADLQDVIETVENEDSKIDIFTSTVFYRDEGDDYVVKKSEFTGVLENTINFINQQSANGGGDFPEAVHSALNSGINELQWSNNARTRIAFLILDAPPHYTIEVKESIHNSIKNAAQKGIKVIPITASGIDKNTEFLMRYMAIATNGTYVFITNDSGIGNDHLEASVGEYQVEFLNDLMIRLIKKYSE